MGAGYTEQQMKESVTRASGYPEYLEILKENLSVDSTPTVTESKFL